MLARNSGDCRSVVLPGGRKVNFAEYGARAGQPMLVLHGTPGSRLKFAVAAAAAEARGLRLISPDRWGYGGTPTHPLPSLSAYAADTAALLDALDIDKAGVMGISGGGPFAAGIAAHLGSRITCAALVAPVGEIAGCGLSRHDLRLMHRFAFHVLPRVPGAVRVLFEPLRALTMVAPSAGAIVATARAAPADRRLMRDRDLRKSLGETFAVGLMGGTHGPVVDLALFSQPWDVDVSKITCAARVWIGSADRNVPIAPAMSLARRIPGAQLTVLADEGHFWIARNFEVVLDWMSEAHHAARDGAGERYDVRGDLCGDSAGNRSTAQEGEPRLAE